MVLEELLLGMRTVRPYFRKLFSYATDMSDAEILILSLLASEEEGNMLLSELQEKLKPIRPSKLTNITNKLEDRGFVNKERSKKDRRKVIIAITPKGRKAYEKFETTLVEAIKPHMEKLTPEEVEVLNRSFYIWKKLLEDI